MAIIGLRRRFNGHGHVRIRPTREQMKQLRKQRARNAEKMWYTGSAVRIGAVWSARLAHNQEVAGSNPASAT